MPKNISLAAPKIIPIDSEKNMILQYDMYKS